MAPPSTVPASELFGCAFESILYGYYVSKFIECASILIRRRRNQKGSLIPHIVTALLFISISTHEFFNIWRNYVSFTTNMSTPLAAQIYWSTKNNFPTKFRTSIWLVPIYISDMFMMYRCFVVWNHNFWVIILPFCLFCANITMGALWLKAYNNFHLGDSVFLGLFSRYSDTVFALTTAFQVLCTAIIATKLWQHHRNLASSGIFSTRSWLSTITVIVESAAVYSAVLIIILGNALAASAALFTLLDILPPIIGIVFSFVIIRLSRGSSTQTTQTGASVSHSIRYGGSRSPAVGRSYQSRSGPTNGVEIKLDTMVTTDEPDVLSAGSRSSRTLDGQKTWSDTYHPEAV